VNKEPCSNARLYFYSFFITMEQSSFQHIDEQLIRRLIIPRPAEGHKGTFGHALIIAGSTGTIGAAILCAKAALRSGCGLLTVHIHKKAETPLLCQLPEAMLSPRKKGKKHLELTRYNAIGFGPGVGVNEDSAQLLLSLLENYRKALVIDADGITLLAQHKDWYHLLTQQMIITPHPKEFDRLTREHALAEDRFIAQMEFSKAYQIIIVLKGHRTTITFPNGEVYRNTTGNDGMATGGSGDVLTGIITSLCAQGYTPQQAALLGTYLHGFAGDVAAEKRSRTSMIASDIIEGIAAFFRKYERSA
jgi:NAD(P)H-hydrate epimerase